ncbi:MAG TPA: polysaccharide deacetylase family protein [Synergistaceae bacterium]|nr:polysaccharide deacetylase family protein [Synergistaceae bacterium]HPJ24822.1 polysaccharide deacetylase family protein [Synergistaceae bacterium]HPQ36261.1 polysaccharide deacetylase family protein [Synergistaceae bacterium]
MKALRSSQKKNLVFIISFLCFFCSSLPAESQVFSKLPASSGSSGKQVALTIDDGPHPGYTERILALLAENKVKANFFLVGKMAATYPYLVRKIAAQGHTIANHSHYHNNLVTLPEENMPLEWVMCNSTLYSILGTFPRFCRPPGGNYNKQVIAAAEKEGLHMVLWTANAGDCTGISAKAIEKKVLARTQPGGIILVHDGVDATIEALPGIIKTLKAKGFRFVTLEEMFPTPPSSNGQTMKASSKTRPLHSEEEKDLLEKDARPSFLTQ